MKFGIFDHMDRATVPLAEQYESRLCLAAAYDAAGFHMYHVAEHHSTPLGMAPSPGIFLSALAQRTRRMHFGPLVYPLALYHPLRLAEEIAMLDHLSGGRFEFGIGKGASGHELAIFGVDPAEGAGTQFTEALAVLRQALTRDRVDFAGKHYIFKDVPVELRPLQSPHPPLWYGVSLPDGGTRAAHNRYNIVSNLPAPRARPIYDAYRTAWAEAGNAPADLPLLGMGRFIVVAEDPAEAYDTANRAYQRWYGSFWKLWDERGGRPTYVTLPETFEGVQQGGFGIAGTPEMVRETLARQIAEAGTNYLVCRFAFGDLTLAESMRSVELFSGQVMPALAASL